MNKTTKKDTSIRDQNQESKAQEEQEAKETARPTKGIKQILPDDIVTLAENVKGRLSRNLGSFMANKKLRNVDLYRAVYPIIPDQAKMSRILNGELPVTLGLCVALHYAYGVDLNQFIAGDNSIAAQMPKEIEDVILEYADYIRQCRNRI